MGRSFRYSTNKNAPLIEFLCDKFTYLQREQWLDHINKGYLTLNGELVSDPHVVLKPNDNITFDAPRELEPDVDATFNVVHEDEDVVVLSKSGNLPVSEGGRYSKNTLCNIATAHFRAKAAATRENGQDTDSQESKLYTVHRLDKETSGLVVMARNNAACNALRKQFEQKSQSTMDDDETKRSPSSTTDLGKLYHTVLLGEMENLGVTRKCTWRIGLATEEQRDAAGETSPPPPPPSGPTLAKIRMKCYPEDSTYGKHALSFVTPKMARNGLTFAEVRIVTGRSHQIRLHCCQLGYPVLGDKLYSAAAAISDAQYLKRTRGEEEVLLEGGGPIPRHMLHAARIQFSHPSTGNVVCFDVSGQDAFVRDCPFLEDILFTAPC